MDNSGGVYRAIVQETNDATGEIVVTIPYLTGSNNRVKVTALNRSAIDGQWKLPEIGAVVLIGTDDMYASTLFLIPTFTYDQELWATDIHGDFEGPAVFRARNDSGSTIPANTVVCGQADGSELVISPANGNDAAKPAIGIAIEDIAPDAYGKVAVSGVLYPFDTTTFAANINLFAGASGNLVSTPVGLSYPQIVAKVLEVGASGTLLLTIENPAAEENGIFGGEFTGTIYAVAGNLGGSASGWVIDSDRIESRGTTQKIVLDGTDGQIYIGTYGTGAYNNASTSFYVDEDGYFSLGDKLTFDPTGPTLDVNGSITADAGTIGGWSIEANKLVSGTGASTVGLSSSGGVSIYAGSTTASVAPFKVTNTGVLTASGVDLSGKIVATSGSVGGWLMDSGKLSSDGVSTPIVLDSANGKVYVGNENYANTNSQFYVDNQGRFSLGNNIKWDPTAPTRRLIIDGDFQANGGAIGGWSITNTQLSAGNTNGDYIALSSDPVSEYRTWAGHLTPASAPFYVKRDGTMRSTSGSIGGWNIGTTSLSAGTGSSAVGLSSSGTYPIWAGNTDPALSPFSVRYDGYVTAASVSTLGGGTGGSPAVLTGRFDVDGGKVSIGRQIGTGASNTGLYINKTVGTTNDPQFDNYLYATGDFRVGDPNSYVTFNSSASTLAVRGTITADSGAIGGWNIGATSLTSGSVGVASSGGYPFYAGSTTASSSAFYVTDTGSLKSTAGSIGGWSISTTSLSASSGFNPMSLASNASPHFFYAGREHYLNLTGASTSYASIAHHSDLNLTSNDIEIVFRIASDDWAPASNQFIVDKYTYGVRLNTDGSLAFTYLFWSAGWVLRTFTSLPLPLNGTTPLWIRIKFDKTNGTSSYVTFEYAEDSPTEPASWTLFYGCIPDSGSSVLTLESLTTNLYVGTAASTGGTAFSGSVYDLYIRSSFGGTKVVDTKFSDQPLGTTSFTDGASRSVTINSPAAITATDYKFKVKSDGAVETQQFTVVDQYGTALAGFGSRSSSTTTYGTPWYDIGLILNPSDNTWQSGGLFNFGAPSTGTYGVDLLGHQATGASLYPQYLSFDSNGSTNNVYLSTGVHDVAAGVGYTHLYLTNDISSPSTPATSSTLTSSMYEITGGSTNGYISQIYTSSSSIDLSISEDPNSTGLVERTKLSMDSTGSTFTNTLNINSLGTLNRGGSACDVVQNVNVVSMSSGVTGASNTTFADVTGATVNLTLKAGDTLVVFGVFDAQQITGSAFVGGLSFDGVDQTEVAILTPSNRVTIAQTWVLGNTSDGTKTLKLRRRCTGNTYNLNATYTRMTWFVLR